MISAVERRVVKAETSSPSAPSNATSSTGENSRYSPAARNASEVEIQYSKPCVGSTVSVLTTHDTPKMMTGIDRT